MAWQPGVLGVRKCEVLMCLVCNDSRALLSSEMQLSLQLFHLENEINSLRTRFLE